MRTELDARANLKPETVRGLKYMGIQNIGEVAQEPKEAKRDRKNLPEYRECANIEIE